MTTAWEDSGDNKGKYDESVKFLEETMNNINEYCTTDCIQNIKSQDDRRFLYSFYFRLKRDLKLLKGLK